jgi:alcohol dehydrogenase class IV
MLWAAHLSGKAINYTRTTGPHAMSYYLTAHFNIPHGQAVALFLPLFFLYNNQLSPSNNTTKDERDAYYQRLHQLYRLLNVNSAAQAFTFVRSFIEKAGLATTLVDLEIEKDAILQPLLESVNHERFANNPVSFNHEKLFLLCKKNL